MNYRLILKPKDIEEYNICYENGIQYSLSNKKKTYKRTNNNFGLALFQYAFETKLNYSQDELFKKIDDKMIEDLCLKSVYDSIDFPVGLNKEIDYSYIIHLIYGNKYTDYMIDTAEYSRQLKMKKSNARTIYFTGENSERRAKNCLLYAIKNSFLFDTVENLYKFFANEQAGNAFLVRYKLNKAQQKNFATPLDYIHESLGSNQKNNTYYEFYKFQNNLHNIHKNKK